ncbi:MAG: response regulator transcription factor [Desulfuromonadaceae bacterium]|nr:response regulator transcription factor [Desulfuromonadaceae bacterium]
MKQATLLFISQPKAFFSDLNYLLSKEDIQTDQVASWQQAQTFIKACHPKLIVLDCPGPGVDGLAVCREIRDSYHGLLVLVSDNADKSFHVLALDLGADYSMVCSEGGTLMAAHIKALLRRFTPSAPLALQTFGELTVDANKRDVFIAGRAAQLSTIEFDLFWSLTQKVGSVMTRDDIHHQLYKTAYNGYDRNVDLYISRIRQKIGDDPLSPRYLKTVRGLGYQFVGDCG